jgi:hypothetical protein
MEVNDDAGNLTPRGALRFFEQSSVDRLLLHKAAYEPT